MLKIFDLEKGKIVKYENAVVIENDEDVSDAVKKEKEKLKYLLVEVENAKDELFDLICNNYQERQIAIFTNIVNKCK